MKGAKKGISDFASAFLSIRLKPTDFFKSDFLLLICRDLIRLRPDLRIILMSATIDSNLFSEYFGGAPVITIPGLTKTNVYLMFRLLLNAILLGRLFPVEKIFLEDIFDKVGYTLNRYSRSWRPPSKKSRRLVDLSNIPFNEPLPPAKDDEPDADLLPHQVQKRFKMSALLFLFFI